MFDREAALEAIAEKVHEAWMAEKLRQGFADHPFVPFWTADGGMSFPVCRQCNKTASDLKHHPDMLPYAELPENSKEYDRASTRIVFDWLEENGWEIVRRGQ